MYPRVCYFVGCLKDPCQKSACWQSCWVHVWVFDLHCCWMIAWPLPHCTKQAELRWSDKALSRCWTYPCISCPRAELNLGYSFGISSRDSQKLEVSAMMAVHFPCSIKLKSQRNNLYLQRETWERCCVWSRGCESIGCCCCWHCANPDCCCQHWQMWRQQWTALGCPGLLGPPKSERPKGRDDDRIKTYLFFCWATFKYI